MITSVQSIATATVGDDDTAQRIHDLRGSIQALAFAIEGAFPTDSVRRARLERMTRQIVELCGTLLHETAAPPLEVVSLEDLARQVVDEHREEARGSGVRLRWRSTARPLVLARARDLRRAVENVVRNAMQFSPDGGCVELAVGTNPAGDARLVVRDEGPGVPPGLRARVFEPHVTTRAGGSGLGLAVVRRVLEQHGGRARFLDEPHGALELCLRALQH